MTSTVWGYKGHDDDGDEAAQVAFTDDDVVQLHVTIWSKEGVATWGVEVTVDRDALQQALLEEGIVTSLVSDE